MEDIKFIINGKRESDPNLQNSIKKVETQRGKKLNIYFTKGEDGEIKREISNESNLKRVVAGGGDGTINQVLNAIKSSKSDLELAILPLGTANDFANSASIPLDIESAINLAIDGDTFGVDVGIVNGKYFLNVATGGFGAQITVETPPALKNLLGGKAYALTGVLKLFSFSPIQAELIVDGYQIQSNAISIAVCNGRQAGGGVVLSPEASIDDGKLDVALFTLDAISLPPHLLAPQKSIFSNLSFRKIFRVSSVKFIPKSGLKLMNLDGEPYEAENFEFEIKQADTKVVLPPKSPLLLNGGRA